MTSTDLMVGIGALAAIAGAAFAWWKATSTEEPRESGAGRAGAGAKPAEAPPRPLTADPPAVAAAAPPPPVGEAPLEPVVEAPPPPVGEAPPPPLAEEPWAEEPAPVVEAAAEAEPGGGPELELSELSRDERGVLLELRNAGSGEARDVILHLHWGDNWRDAARAEELLTSTDAVVGSYHRWQAAALAPGATLWARGYPVPPGKARMAHVEWTLAGDGAGQVRCWQLVQTAAGKWAFERLAAPISGSKGCDKCPDKVAHGTCRLVEP